MHARNNKRNFLLLFSTPTYVAMVHVRMHTFSVPGNAADIYMLAAGYTPRACLFYACMCAHTHACTPPNSHTLQDPACTSYSQALLYYKGYHAIQTHRIAHALWARGQRVMAVALQSRMSEVWVLWLSRSRGGW
jgi:Serine acetyltransferase, N-terminal